MGKIDKAIIAISVKKRDRTKIGLISALIPKTKVKLKILDPTILPKASSVLPRYAAIILVTNSGKDVPSATANKEIKGMDNPNKVAIEMAESMSKWPPRGRKVHPITNKPIDLYKGADSKDSLEGV